MECFLCCRDARAGWFKGVLVHLLQQHTKSSSDITQQYKNKQSIFFSRTFTSPDTIAFDLYNAWTLYIIPEKASPLTPWCLSAHSFPSISQFEKWKDKTLSAEGQVITVCERLHVGWSYMWSSRRRWRSEKPAGRPPWRLCLFAWLYPQTFSS